MTSATFIANNSEWLLESITLLPNLVMLYLLFRCLHRRKMVIKKAAKVKEDLKEYKLLMASFFGNHSLGLEKYQSRYQRRLDQSPDQWAQYHSHNMIFEVQHLKEIGPYTGMLFTISSIVLWGILSQSDQVTPEQQMQVFTMALTTSALGAVISILSTHIMNYHLKPMLHDLADLSARISAVEVTEEKVKTSHTSSNLLEVEQPGIRESMDTEESPPSSCTAKKPADMGRQADTSDHRMATLSEESSYDLFNKESTENTIDQDVDLFEKLLTEVVPLWKKFRANPEVLTELEKYMEEFISLYDKIKNHIPDDNKNNSEIAYKLFQEHFMRL